MKINTANGVPCRKTFELASPFGEVPRRTPEQQANAVELMASRYASGQGLWDGVPLSGEDKEEWDWIQNYGQRDEMLK